MEMIDIVNGPTREELFGSLMNQETIFFEGSDGEKIEAVVSSIKFIKSHDEHWAIEAHVIRDNYSQGHYAGDYSTVAQKGYLHKVRLTFKTP